MYSVDSYFVSKNLAELSAFVFIPILNTPVYYWMIGLKPFIVVFFYYMVDACIYVALYAVAYLGKQLILTKSRLSRTKTITDPTSLTETIPKLEWKALIVAGELVEYLKSILTLSSIIVLGDSSLCLDRLNQHPNTMKPHLALQAMKLQAMLQGVVVGHVQSKLNRADALSRGESIRRLNEIDWWTLDEVPPFTTYRTVTIPISTTSILLCKNSIKLSYSKSYTKLLQFCIPFGRCLKNRYRHLTSVERAELALLRFSQRDDFPEDIAALARGSIPPLETTLHYQMRIHSDGLIHLDTRLTHSTTLSSRSTSPILIGPRLAILLIRHLHCLHSHTGVRDVLLRFREKFFCRRSRQLTLNELRKCRICVHLYGQPLKIPLAPLPDYRSSTEPQFSNIRIDMFGPLHASTELNPKLYGLMVTCLQTQAVHTEIVPSLSAADLLISLRTIFALYTIPKIIVSDNGTNFTRIAKSLKRLQTACDSSLLNIRWIFFTPAAPWRGGIFERMIKTFKRAFSCVTFKRRTMTTLELRTIFYEICATLNSRPLVEADGVIVTPRHFSGAHHIPYITRAQAETLSTDPIAHSFVISQKTLNNVWRHWFRLYLLELKDFLKQAPSNPHLLKEDDVVLIDIPNATREQWPLATIVRRHFGTDGLVRTFDLRLPNGKEITRAAQRLVPLEGTWSN